MANQNGMANLMETTNENEQTSPLEEQPGSDVTSANTEAQEDASYQENQEINMGSLLTHDGERAALDSESLQDLSVDDLRRSINRIDSNANKDNLSFETEFKLERKLNEMGDTVSEALQCSEALCGFLCSSHDEEVISNALDQLSRDEELRSISTGGVIRVIEENAIHHGFLILVLNRGEQLQIR